MRGGLGHRQAGVNPSLPSPAKNNNKRLLKQFGRCFYCLSLKSKKTP